jgi:lactoylglutathione lyase
MTSFPAIYVSDLQASLRFYEQLGFDEDYRMPPGDDAGYIGLHHGDTRLGLVKKEWPEQQLGIEPGASPRFELWVYVDDVDVAVAEATAPVLKEPEDMPWGERIAYLADPDGNPVPLAHRPS